MSVKEQIGAGRRQLLQLCAKVKLVSFIWCVVTFCFFECSAQSSLPFKEGEQLNYDISYKYGIVMIKAGNAAFSLRNATYNSQPTIKSVLNFKTNSFFDKIYKVRDTLISHVNDNLQPMYHERSVNEGNTKFFEQLFFIKQSDTYTEARVRREVKEKVKIDTVMQVDGAGYDMLNIFLFARTLDYQSLQIDQTFPLTVFLGKQKTKAKMRYKGQSIIEKSERLKYKSFRFEVDIMDEAFAEEKTAMEIWISDDMNHVPLKLKAKLKIGAAEATLSSYENLKHPLSSEVRLNPK